MSNAYFGALFFGNAFLLGAGMAITSSSSSSSTTALGGRGAGTAKTCPSAAAGCGHGLKTL